MGVIIAVFGVIAAWPQPCRRTPGAWRGEAGAVLCMAFYNVWSRPFIVRSSTLGSLGVGMGAGALALIAIGLMTDRLAVLRAFDAAQWPAGVCLVSAAERWHFILWVLALQRTTPTRVASTMTVNPMAAAPLASALIAA